MVLTIANASQRNALGAEIYTAGIEALDGAESNADVRSVVIVGEDAWFSVGRSPQQLQSDRQRDLSEQAENINALHGWIESIRTFPKPVIAAVEGDAVGAGFALALACDFIVASQDAVFAASHAMLALSPDGGLSWHLARALPRQLASEWILLGERIEAQRLHALGLVNALTEPGQALTRALALARRLNERAPNALASAKELLGDARGASLPDHLASERDHFLRNLHHANAGIGIASSLARTPPPHYE